MFVVVSLKSSKSGSGCAVARAERICRIVFYILGVEAVVVLRVKRMKQATSNNKSLRVCMVSLVSCRCVVCLYFLVLWLFLFCWSALESNLKKKGSILFLLTSAAHKISFLLLFLLTLLLAAERMIIKISIKNRYEMTLDGDVSLDGLAVGLRYSNSAVFEYLGIFKPSFSHCLSSCSCIFFHYYA